MTRFQLYPYLEKGFEATARGDGARAISEFERAYRLAPQSAVVAAYLVQAYHQFGQTARARTLVNAQLHLHPGNAQLLRLRDMLRETVPAAPQATVTTSPAGPDAPSSPTVQVSSAMDPPAPPSAAPATKLDDGRRVTIPRSRSVPLTRPPRIARAVAEPGFSAADAAYKASERRDYEAAASLARTAVAQSPHNVDYRRLLVFALLESGAYEAAQSEAASGPAGDARLAELAEDARRRQAFQLFEAANQAAAQQDVDRAAALAASGVALAPKSRAHYLQLAGLLLRQGDWTATVDAVQRAFQSLGGEDAELLVLRAYAYQRLNDIANATADHDRALALARDPGVRQQNLRVIAADAAMAAGQAQRSLDLLAPLPSSEDPYIDQRRAQAMATLRRPAVPSPVVTNVRGAPKVICVGSSFTPLCDVWPGEALPVAGQDQAQAAYDAMSRQSYAEAVDHARAASVQAPQNAQYQLLLLRALMSSDQWDEALRQANVMVATSQVDPELLAARSDIYRRLQQPAMARADAEAALRDPRLSVGSEIHLLLETDPGRAKERFDVALRNGELAGYPDADLAYLSIRMGDDAGALSAFDRAAQANALPARALLDAGYAAGRLGRADEAVQYFSRGLDAVEAGQLALEPQRVFETRRSIADRTRSWGAVASVGYRGGQADGRGAAAPVTIGDSTQAGVELYWRPTGYGDGRYAELYVGGFQTLWAKGAGASGHDTAQALVGARVKPLRDTNLVLAVERRIKVGSLSVNDWLLRAGYSFTHGTDLRVDADAWNTVQVYAEAGRFLRTHLNYATVEAQFGRSFRMDSISPRLVVFPHLVAGADFNSRLPRGQRDASGAGIGLAGRYWFNEDRYNAPRSYLDLSLQYRARLGGDERGKGVFLRASLVY